MVYRTRIPDKVDMSMSIDVVSYPTLNQGKRLVRLQIECTNLDTGKANCVMYLFPRKQSLYVAWQFAIASMRAFLQI
jgi:hypothetical protein